MFVSALVSAAVLASGIAAPNAAKIRPVNEGDDVRPCVTYEEYVAVHIGMPKRRMHRILDTRGAPLGRRSVTETIKLFGGTGPPDRYTAVRAYPVCPDPVTGLSGVPLLVQFNLRRVPDRVSAVLWGIGLP